MTEKPWFTTRSKSIILLPLVIVVAVVVVFFRRDDPSSQVDPRQDDSGRSRTAASTLNRMLALYENASTYRDHTEIRLRHRVNGRTIDDRTVIDVSYFRPNKIRYKVTRGHNDVLIVSDGELLQARIMDPPTENFDNQVVENPAPDNLTVQDIYRAAEYLDLTRPNQMMSALLGLPIQLDISPVGLLTSPDAVRHLTGDSRQARMLRAERFDKRWCSRIAITAAAGRFVFWIDQSNHQLRRIEYPTQGLLDTSGDSTASPMSLVADFEDVELNSDVSNVEYQLELPPDAKRLRNFVYPPPAMPTSALGRAVGTFSFVSLDNQSVDSDQWNEKLLVLLWFQNHPASLHVLQQLEAVRSGVKQSARVQFIAVCAEPYPDKSHDDVARLVSRHKISIPVVRDLHAIGRDTFAINNAPTLVVISEDGVVQLVDEGGNPQLESELPVVIERLLDGEDIGKDYLHFVKSQHAEYERQLAASSVEAPPPEAEISPTPIARRTSPENLQITKLWTVSDIEDPGNIYVDRSASGHPTVLVLEGWNRIVQLDQTGRILQRHLLEIPEQAAVSLLRSAGNSAGEQFHVGFSRFGQQFYVFSDTWHRRFAYPDRNQNHPGIRDATLADLDADGKLEFYVAFGGIVGIHRVAMDGERVWSNRQITSASSLTPTHSSIDDRQLLVASQIDQLRTISENGKEQPTASLETPVTHQLFSSIARSRRRTVYCGLTQFPDGRTLAIGLNGQIQQAWGYKLPPGIISSQIEPVVSCRLFDDASHYWLMAGPDGTIHLVADDGAYFDSFAYGSALTGVNAVRWGQDSVLFVAADGNVTAWSIER